MRSLAHSRPQYLYVGAIVWLVLVVALASWWLIFGLLQTHKLAALGDPDVETAPRMLIWEGISLIGLLLAGGMALVISVRREHARQYAIEAFFMAFTHDLKTSLASLQLQAESLSEDLPEAAANPNMARLLKDTRRLGVQLENSLFFAQPEGKLLVQPVSIAEFITRIAADWPEIMVRVEGAETVLADARALESVWRNLLQNAVIHGHARAVRVRIERYSAGRVRITAADDGRGPAPQSIQSLGRAVKPRASTDGTGVGLFVSRQLASRMNGDLRFHGALGAGFTAVLELPIAR